MVEFDTTFLIWMFVPGAKHSLPDAKDRVSFLLSELSARGDQIVVPTPVLSEILIKSGKARNAIIHELSKNPRFLLAPFDTRAAIELSLMSDAAIASGDKKHGAVGTWAKVKFDRQIVAIGKVLRVSCIYSDDGDVHTIGTREGLKVQGLGDIVVPSSAGTFKLTPPGVK
jgi:hypothetical protein